MKNRQQKRSFKSLIRLKFILILGAVSLGFGLDYLNRKIDEHRYEAHLIGKTLRALFTLEIFDRISTLGEDIENGENQNLDVTLNQSSSNHYVTIDDMRVVADNSDQCTKFYKVRCHADLDVDIHGFVQDVVHNHKNDLGIQAYDLRKQNDKIHGEITFSQYTKRP